MFDPYAYHVVISKFISEDTICFKATCLELPNLEEFGETYYEVYELIIDSISTAKEAFEEFGYIFPKPLVGLNI